MNSIVGISAVGNDFEKGRTSHIKVLPTHNRYTTSTRIIGLQFSGNTGTRQILDMMGAMLSFPTTIEMPCGWSVIIPTLEGCCHDLECPCGNSDHWIIKWERQYETLPQDPNHLQSRPSYKIQDAPAL